MRYDDASGAFQASGPVANDDADTLSAGERGPATGNLITGEGTQYASAGADSAAGAHITAIAGKGGEDTSFAAGKLSVEGEHGRLTVDADGNYSYLAKGNVENVRDRFTYTLADNGGNSDTAALIIEIGKTPAVIKANAQQIVPGPDGVVTLPPGVDLSDVHVVGRNLVIDMPDGTQLIIIDGAIFVPQLVLGGVEVPATNVAALLIGQEVQPAAGEIPPSSGGNFALPPPPLDPGIPLGDLIPPTEYNYIPPEPQEIFQPLDEEPEAGTVNAALDDDARPGGIAGGPGDDPDAVNLTGFLPGSGGDGNLTWSLLLTGAPAGFTYVDGPGESVLVQQGGVTVLTITIDPATGEYSIVQNAAIDHAAGNNENNTGFTINYAVTDEDGDVALGTLNIDVDDDTPTVDATVGPDGQVLLTTQDAQTDGDPTDTDTDSTSADFGGIFGATGAFGADGPGTSSLSYALSTTGGASGLMHHGEAINLYLIGGVVVGSTAASSGAVNASNTVFDISVNAVGVVTVNQYSQIDHTNTDPSPTGPGYEDHLISLTDGSVTLTLTATVTDGDQDTVTDTASVGIGANIRFADDGPSIDPTLNEVGSAIVDESAPVDAATIALVGGFTAGDDPHLSGGLAIGKGSTSGPVVDANAVFGADGPAAGGGISYGLEVGNTVSGLTTTEGVAINLVELANGVVVGVVDGTQTVAFAVSIDSNTGIVTVEQYLSLFHPDSPNNFDEPIFLNEGSLGVTVTASDFDGDSVTSNPVDITPLIRFEDDGPTINPALNANATVTVDESLPSGTPGIDTGGIAKGDDPDLAGGVAIGQANSGVAIVNANAVFGADGPAAQGSLVYALSITNPDPGVTLTDGTSITMQLVNGVIVGVVDSGPFDGEAAFAISIDPTTGIVTVEQYLSLDHPVNPDPNDPLGLGDNSVAVNVTATDGDGDQVTSDDIDISGQITFLDDGPQVAPTLNVNATVTVDETLPSSAPGINTGLIVKGDDPDLAGGVAIGQANSGSAIVDPHAVFGADGAAAGGGISYALSILNVSSGLTLTDGTPINLQMVGGVIVGVVNGGTFDGQAAFAIAINSTTGVVTVEQYLSLDHPVNPNPNDPLSFGSNVIGVTVTATDGDGDPVTSPAVDVGGQITFLDDGPSANDDSDTTDPLTDQASGNVITGVGTNEGPGNADVPGADGFGTISNLVGFNGSSDNNPLGGFTVNGEFGTLQMDANGNYTYTRTSQLGGGETETFTYTYLDGDGDPATAILEILIADETPVAGNVNVQLDDDALAGGNPGGVGDDPDSVNASGTLPGSGGDAPLTFGVLLTGAPAGFTYVSGGAGIVLVQQGGVTVLTITVNAATGGYTVVQNNPIDHAAGLDENNVSFTINYTVTDSDLDVAPGTISINVDDDTPTVSANAGVQLDDDALAGGNPGGTGDDPNATNVSGTLAHSYGADGAGSVAYLTTGAPAGFSYALQGNGDLWVMQGATHVLTLTVNATTGAYTVSQVAPISHVAGLDENNQAFTISYRVTDGDGDTVDGSISVNVDDDTPTVSANAAVQLDDDALAGGNPGGTGDDPNATNVSGTLAHSYGADGAGSVAYLTTGAPAGFSYALQGNGDLWVMQGATHVLTLTVNASTGAYNVSQVAPISHVAGNDENNQSFTISYRVTDSDGDPVDGTIVVNVDDDTPTVSANAAVQLDDDALAGGNPGGTGDDPNATNVSGTLAHSYGADGAGTVAYLTTGAPAGFSYVLQGNGDLWVMQGATHVLTLTVNASTGAYNVSQVAPISHAAGLDENNQSFTISYRVTDSDGDPVDGTIVVNVDDDTPTVSANAAVQLDDDALAGGNPGGTGDDPNATNVSGTLGFSFGADGAGTIAYLTTGAPAGFSYALQGNGDLWVMQGATHVLTLTVNATTGAYSVSQVAPIAHVAGNDENNASFTISYRVTDSDGDPVDGTIVVNVDDDTPTVSANAAVQLDDDALTGGNPGGTGDDPNATNVSGTLAHSYGADGAGTVAYLTTGAPAGFSYALQGNGDLWVMQGATHVLTLTVNASTGAYNVSQVAPIVHAAGLDENNQSFTINYRVTDSDGDPVDGSIVVNVDDDTPTATIVASGQNVSVDESVGIQVDSNDTTSAGVIALFAGVANVGTDTDLPQYAQNASAIVAATGSSVGADTPGTTAFSLDVSSAGVDSGLNTTAGNDILLFKEGNLVVGRVSGGADDGKAAFALAINPSTGVISMVEYLSIQHSDAANPDDMVSIANGALLAVVTVTDADSDSASQSLAIGSHIQFQDSGPVMTAASNINIQNSGDVAHTGTFAFNLGADGANIATNDVITNLTGSATVGGVAVTNWILTPGVENASTASYSFSFDYPIGGGNTAHETGTLVFDKVAGTYTVDLANPIQGVTTILQTATGTLFQGYEFGSSTLDGSQPAISVTQIQDLAGTANDIYVQFTSVAEPSSGTGDNNLEFSNWVPGADNPAPVSPGGDTTWNPGDVFNQTDSWVSTSNDANGVAGDTIQGGEVLDFNLVQGANPTGILANPSTYAQASSMFLKFDGIGASEDMIVVLKLYDTVAHTYTTVALMVQNSDIQKGPGSGPGIYSGITLDQNDGLIVIEPNDYQQGNTNLVIVGAQISGSDEGLSGTAIDFTYGGVLGVASTGTQSFATDTNDGPFKISSIGFTTVSTTPQNAHLDFNVTVTDGDGDSITQAIAVDVTTAADSSTPIVLGGGVTTINSALPPDPVGSDSSFSASNFSFSNDNSKLGGFGNGNGFGNIGNTGITSAMVAASGFAMMSTTSLSSFNDPSSAALVQDNFQQLSTQIVGRESVGGEDFGSLSLGSQLGGSAVDAVNLASSGISFEDHGFVSRGIEAVALGDAHPAYVPNYASGEPAVANVAAMAANVPVVSMASADMLRAASLDGNVQHGGAVEQVLADTLGNHAPTIDAVLANLPGGIAELSTIANLASGNEAGVPAWDMGMHGAFALSHDMLFKVAAVVVHQDAVQPA